MDENELPHDFSVLSEKLPVFYPADALQAMEERLTAHKNGEGYLLPSGMEPDLHEPFIDARGTFAYTIALTLSTLSRTDQGYHIIDITELGRLLPDPTEEDPAVAVALAEVHLLIQATYANAGDNDTARGIAGAEHFLLDLETLYSRA